MDALAKTDGLKCYLVETEFWGQMASPNLLAEYSVDDVADLVAATSFHRGEVQRNPYHLRLPAWMQDNVRRGGSWSEARASRAPAFVFAQLFRLRRWNSGRIEACGEGGRKPRPPPPAPASFFPGNGFVPRTARPCSKRNMSALIFPLTKIGNRGYSRNCEFTHLLII